MNILTINLLFSTLVLWIAARLYLLPRIDDLEPSAILLPILLLHAFRQLGDLLAAILALIAIAALVARARHAMLLVWLFNIEGMLDLIAAISLATIYDAAPFMGPAYWIPAFWVPALIVTHYVTSIVLLRRRLRPA